MTNTKMEKSFWRQSDTWRVGQILFLGLALGATVHWMNLSAPPLSVSAREDEPASTNAPVEIKIEGASQSDPG